MRVKPRVLVTGLGTVASLVMLATIWPNLPQRFSTGSNSQHAQMVSGSGVVLGSFFEGLPTSKSWVGGLEAFTAKRELARRGGVPPLFTRVGHFLGIGAVVYAQSGTCGGDCYEWQLSQACDCGTQYYTQYRSWSGNGISEALQCTACYSFLDGGTTCALNGC